MRIRHDGQVGETGQCLMRFTDGQLFGFLLQEQNVADFKMLE